jgi:hypothetical protein
LDTVQPGDPGQGTSAEGSVMQARRRGEGCGPKRTAFHLDSQQKIMSGLCRLMSVGCIGLSGAQIMRRTKDKEATWQ